MRKQILTSAILALALTASAGSGGTDLDGVHLGKLVMGPALTIEQCKGNVVLLEFWGTR